MCSFSQSHNSLAEPYHKNGISFFFRSQTLGDLRSEVMVKSAKVYMEICQNCPKGNNTGNK